MSTGQCECGNLARCLAPVRHATPIDSYALDPLNKGLFTTSMRSWNAADQPHMLPKVVHQTWKACNSVPDRQHSWREGCRKMNPDWTFHLWNDADNRRLLTEADERFRPLLDVYDGYPVPINRVDFARLLYLYRYGGIYMDLE